MKPTTRRSTLLLSLITPLIVLMLGCSATLSTKTANTLPASSVTFSPTITSTSTKTPIPNLLKTRISGVPRTLTARPTHISTPTGTATPIPSPTAPQIDAAIFQFNSDNTIPSSITQVREDNLTQLVQIAQWGKGSIQRIIFSPDGKTMLAASPYGIAIYPMDDFLAPLQWLLFDSPIYFQDIQISTDGNLIRLQWPQYYPSTGKESRVFNLEKKTFQPADQDIDWILSQYNQIVSYTEAAVISPDNKLRFEGRLDYQEENMNIETFQGLIFDNQTGEQRLRLKDESLYVYYEDYNEPDGCDLESFTVCGNVYDPNIMTPYRVAFSTSGKLLAIIYRSTNLGNSNHFSLLRVYSTQDGSIINTFGSFDQPVQDFSFQPGSDLISVAFVNGSIQTWDPAQQKMLNQTWDFRPPVRDFAYTSDGRYLLVQYPDSVEVLRTSDGAIAGRYESSAIALSPTENLLAIGDDTGIIQVEDLDQRKTVSRMVGHSSVIYALAFAPDGQTLISSSEDCTIRSWDAHTGIFQHYFEKAEVNAFGESWTESRIFVYYMHFVPGTNQLVGFGSWGTAASWNINSGVKEYAIVSQPLEYYNGMQTLNPHFPQSFWVVPEESRFYINESAYDLKNGEAAGSYTPPSNLPEGCSPEGPQSSDGKIRFTSGYGPLEGQICVLGMTDNRLMYRIPVFPQQNDGAISIQQIFLSPDGTRLFVVSLDGPIFVYQVQP